MSDNKLSKLQEAKNSENEALANLNDYIRKHQNELPPELVQLYKSYTDQMNSTSSMLLSMVEEKKLEMEREEKRYNQKLDEINQEFEQKIKDLPSEP